MKQKKMIKKRAKECMSKIKRGSIRSRKLTIDSTEKEWRKDFENIPKGYCLVSFEGKATIAYKETKRSRVLNYLALDYDGVWYHNYFFKYFDGWMPLPEGMRKR